MVTSQATFNHDYNSGPPDKRMRQTLLSFAKKTETPCSTTKYEFILSRMVTALFLKCMRLDQYNKYDRTVVAFQFAR